MVDDDGSIIARDWAVGFALGIGGRIDIKPVTRPKVSITLATSPALVVGEPDLADAANWLGAVIAGD
jgi:hypothetical protein